MAAAGFFSRGFSWACWAVVLGACRRAPIRHRLVGAVGEGAWRQAACCCAGGAGWRGTVGLRPSTRSAVVWCRMGLRALHGLVTQLVEFLRGCKVKYEFDEATVLIKEHIVPGYFLCACPIGLMPMIDQGEKDNKTIAVCADGPEYRHFRDINEPGPHRPQEIRHFFEDYKKSEKKEIAVNVFLPAEDAINAIKYSMETSGESNVISSRNRLPHVYSQRKLSLVS